MYATVNETMNKQESIDEWKKEDEEEAEEEEEKKGEKNEKQDMDALCPVCLYTITNSSGAHVMACCRHHYHTKCYRKVLAYLREREASNLSIGARSQCLHCGVSRWDQMNED